jgi:hypothetical protein
MRIRKLIGITALSLMTLGLIGTGCHRATLQPGGAYSPGTTNDAGIFIPTQMPDITFYQIDAAFDLAYSTVDAAFKFERDNRLLLWKVSPQIKHTLDTIRPKAQDISVRYLLARSVYLMSPTPAGLTKLQSILSEISNIAVAATAALPKGQ